MPQSLHRPLRAVDAYPKPSTTSQLQVEAVAAPDYGPGHPEEPQTAPVAEALGLPPGHPFGPRPFDPLQSEPLDWPAYKTVGDLHTGLDHHDINPPED